MTYFSPGANPASRTRLWRQCPLAAAAALACCLAFACGTADEQQQPPPVEAPLTSFDSGVELNISVGFFNGRLLFTNQSDLPLKRILVVVNEGEGETEYRGEMSGMQPNFMLHYSPTIFSNPSGVKLDPKAVELNSVTVYADTPRGRGRWSGNY